MRKLFLVAVLATISIFSMAHVSFAQQCDSGWGLCPSGGCAPMGSVCLSDGTYAPGGSVICSNNRYCPSGYICASDGEHCIDASSSQVCADGHSYCHDGYYCGTDNKCYPESGDDSSGGNSGTDDQSSGVTDAAYCIDVESAGGDGFRIRNTCTFGVKADVETMDISRTTSVDSYYVGANDYVAAFSYFGYTPVVKSAFGQ